MGFALYLSTKPRIPRACSSVDRASASGAEGRRFESCRARQYPLLRWTDVFGQCEGESHRICVRSQTGRNKLGASDDDAFVDRVQQLSLIHISEPTRLGMISYAV